MAEKIRQFDNLIVSFFEAICHKIQLFSGITNFTISKVLVLCSVLAYIEEDTLSAKVIAWAVIEITVRIYIVYRVEMMTKFSHGTSFANPSRYVEIFLLLRYVYLALAIKDAFSRVNTVYESIFIWLFYVIVACAPLPPGESKLRSFFRGLNAGKLAHENVH